MPNSRLTLPDAGCGGRHCCLHIDAVSLFFLGVTCVDSALSWANAHGIWLIRAESVCIGYSHRYRCWTSRFRLKFKKKKKQNKTKGVKHTVWAKITTAYILVHSYLYLSSHLQLSLTLWSLCSTPWLSVSPLSHNLTLNSLSHLHNLTLNSQLTHTLLSISPQVSISSFQS